VKINLTKANALYDEVGIYEMTIKVTLENYPTITRQHLVKIHVLHPCKNFRKFPFKDEYYGADEVWKFDVE